MAPDQCVRGRATLRPLLAPGRHLSGLGAATLSCWHLEAPDSWTREPPGAVLAATSGHLPSWLTYVSRLASRVTGLPGGQEVGHGPVSHRPPALRRISKISAGNSGRRARARAQLNSSTPRSPGSRQGLSHTRVGIRRGCVHRPPDSGAGTRPLCPLGFLLRSLPFLGSRFLTSSPLDAATECRAAEAHRGEWAGGARRCGHFKAAGQLLPTQNSPHDPRPTYSPVVPKTHGCTKPTHGGLGQLHSELPGLVQPCRR